MLSRYSAWANDRLYETLAALPGPELTKPHPIVFGSILRTLNHVYLMDLVWRAHLQGTSHGFTTRNPDECPAFAELRAAQIEIDEWYIEYSDDIQESGCAEVVNFSFIGGGSGSMSRGDILLPRHQSHHVPPRTHWQHDLSSPGGTSYHGSSGVLEGTRETIGQTPLPRPGQT
jgi:uncharacterized damage-inducible protein DinB